MLPPTIGDDRPISNASPTDQRSAQVASHDAKTAAKGTAKARQLTEIGWRGLRAASVSDTQTDPRPLAVHMWQDKTDYARYASWDGTELSG
jgi:hypothetical protein